MGPTCRLSRLNSTMLVFCSCKISHKMIRPSIPPVARNLPQLDISMDMMPFSCVDSIFEFTKLSLLSMPPEAMQITIWQDLGLVAQNPKFFSPILSLDILPSGACASNVQILSRECNFDSWHIESVRRNALTVWSVNETSRYFPYHNEHTHMLRPNAMCAKTINELLSFLSVVSTT
mmetsp:Transcript_11598/g.35744  ORF Transcript_11598/g.35744 Transcript_11598/m.35744 type:complete len:176 (-) Transcript_11598:208-735(-)